MSTRSHVRVYKNNDELAAFYHHYDVYLEGVGKEMVDIAKKESITSPEQFIADLDASYEKRFSLSKSDDRYIDYLYYVFFLMEVISKSLIPSMSLWKMMGRLKLSGHKKRNYILKPVLVV